jgi:hypothetical protein
MMQTKDTNPLRTLLVESKATCIPEPIMEGGFKRGGNRFWSHGGKFYTAGSDGNRKEISDGEYQKAKSDGKPAKGGKGSKDSGGRASGLKNKPTSEYGSLRAGHNNHGVGDAGIKNYLSDLGHLGDQIGIKYDIKGTKRTGLVPEYPGDKPIPSASTNFDATDLAKKHGLNFKGVSGVTKSSGGNVRHSVYIETDEGDELVFDVDRTEPLETALPGILKQLKSGKGNRVYAKYKAGEDDPTWHGGS